MKKLLTEEITSGMPEVAITEAVDALVLRLSNELKGHVLAWRSNTVPQRSEALSSIPDFADGLRKELNELLRERVSQYFDKQIVYTNK